MCEEAAVRLHDHLITRGYEALGGCSKLELGRATALQWPAIHPPWSPKKDHNAPFEDADSRQAAWRHLADRAEEERSAGPQRSCRRTESVQHANPVFVHEQDSLMLDRADARWLTCQRRSASPRWSALRGMLTARRFVQRTAASPVRVLCGQHSKTVSHVASLQAEQARLSTALPSIIETLPIEAVACPLAVLPMRLACASGCLSVHMKRHQAHELRAPSGSRPVLAHVLIATDAAVRGLDCCLPAGLALLVSYDCPPRKARLGLPCAHVCPCC